MRVEVRLYAAFAAYAPSGRAGDPFDVVLDEPATLGDLIRIVNLPPDQVHLAMVDGRIVHDRLCPLQEDDRVGLFPPVGGG